MARLPVDDETLTELPPLDDEGEGDPRPFADDEPELEEEGDPLDDASASLGDDGLEVDDVDSSHSLDDDAGLDDDASASDLDPLHGEDGLARDLEEPGIGDEAFDIEDGVLHDVSTDKGEEGPSEADEELRAEDLPELDADDDGEAAEVTFYEPTPYVSVPRGLGFSWADRAWESSRVAEGPFAFLAGTGDGCVALSLADAPQPDRIVELRFGRDGAKDSIVVREVAPIPGPRGTSLAVSWKDDGTIVLGGAEACLLPAGDRTWTTVDALSNPPVPVRVVGTTSGVFGLAPKGQLCQLAGGVFLPSPGLSEGLAASVDEPSPWVQAIGATPLGDLVVLATDDTSGEVSAKIGKVPAILLPALPEELTPTAVTALGPTLAVLADEGVFVSWSGEPFALLEGTRGARGVCIRPMALTTEVLTAQAEDEGIVLLLHIPETLPKVVAVLEPREDSTGDASDGVSGALFVDSMGGRVIVATSFGLFVVRPPQRAE
jgi:hypothetical protein